MSNVTVYTIIYNNYGKFLNNWINCINHQSVKPSEIIVVLGKDHGVEKYKFPNIKFIESDSIVMGHLRNLAIKEITSEFMLYFSVDDILLSNALETLLKYSKYDVIALTFEDIQIMGTSKRRKSAIFDKSNMHSWKSLYNIPGYIMVRTNLNGIKPYYEEIEIPNYPYLFMLGSLTNRQIQTTETLAQYKRREKSHGDTSSKNGRWQTFIEYIDEYAKQYSGN